MAAICFMLLCISLPIVLWKENKDSLYAISEFHIIRHAVTMIDIMSLTLSVVTEKVALSPFRSDGSNIQFHGELHCRSCSVSLTIPR